MGMPPLVSNDSPASASIVDVPASKEITAPSADDPSAIAPAETSKPPACRKRGVWHARCSWVALRSVRLVRWVAACILSWFCYILATEIFFCAYLLLHATLHAALLPPVPASEVLQELVETGATMYGGNWTWRTPWEIDGHLYLVCYSLQELSEKLGLQPVLGDDAYYSASHCAYTWENFATIFSYCGYGTFEIVMFVGRALLFTIWVFIWLRITPVILQQLGLKLAGARSVGPFAARALAAATLAFAAFAAAHFSFALLALFWLAGPVAASATDIWAKEVARLKTVIIGRQDKSVLGAN